jgi:hypothetical protein
MIPPGRRGSGGFCHRCHVQWVVKPATINPIRPVPIGPMNSRSERTAALRARCTSTSAPFCISAAAAANTQVRTSTPAVHSSGMPMARTGPYWTSVRVNSPLTRFSIAASAWSRTAGLEKLATSLSALRPSPTVNVMSSRCLLVRTDVNVRNGTFLARGKSVWPSASAWASVAAVAASTLAMSTWLSVTAIKPSAPRPPMKVSVMSATPRPDRRATPASASPARRTCGSG